MIWMEGGIESSLIHSLGMETRSSFVHILGIFNLYPVISENTLASQPSNGFLHFFCRMQLLNTFLNQYMNWPILPTIIKKCS
jgi:antibiotic biosynthesis monooxygenase (ABM) superfamily enzyme